MCGVRCPRCGVRAGARLGDGPGPGLSAVPTHGARPGETGETETLRSDTRPNILLASTL